MQKHVAAAVAVSLSAVLLDASCVQSPTSALEAEGASGGAPAIETTDDDSFGSDPDVGGSIDGDPAAGGGFSRDPDVGGGIGSDPDVGGGIGSDPPASYTGTSPGDAHNPYYLVPIGQDPGATHARFGPNLFPFYVYVKDDGKGEGGGWQRADAKLGFVRMQWGMIPTYVWQCDIRVEVPIRTKMMGRISPRWAAVTSAQVASEASDVLLPEEEWQGRSTEFCLKLREGMNRMFSARYDKLGARVVKDQ